ncbi:MAG: nucleoside-triphosphatase [Candidatus Nitrosocaldus sp.]
MLILLTGEPGVGKSTVLLRLVELLREEGVGVGGVIAKEVRDEVSGDCSGGKGRRIGFEFIDVTSNSRVRLASIGIDGPRVGRYGIDLDGCKAAANMLLKSMNSNVIVFDEIGPMELLSPHIIESLQYLLDESSREDIIVIVVMHKRFKHWIINRYKERASMLVEVSKENRGSLPEMLLDTIRKNKR